MTECRNGHQANREDEQQTKTFLQFFSSAPRIINIFSFLFVKKNQFFCSKIFKILSSDSVG